MKKYNSTVTITVDVDSIANKLYELINPDFKHRDILVESIIGTSLHTRRISDIFNAMNGFEKTIDFKVGDKVMTEGSAIKVSAYNPNIRDTEYTVFNEGVVIDIDVYRTYMLCVRITYPVCVNEIVETTTKDVWVDHTEWNKVPNGQIHEDIFNN